MRKALKTSLALAALFLAVPLSAPAQQAPPLAAPAQAVAPVTMGDWVTSISLQGTPRYKAGFAHFDYVNPDAPKGGTFKLSGSSPTFDTVNPFLQKGVPADGIGLVLEQLMTPSLDEVDISAEYPQLAEAVRFPSDYSSVTYRLNAKAKWQDGTPVTADDVVWSFNKLIDLNPSQKFYYQHVKSVAKTGDREVTFTFDQAGNRELPHIVGQLNVLPQHWWEGKDAAGKQRDISQGTLEPVMGSGPYKMTEVVAGRSIAYQRDKNFWGADLNTNIGQNNFDTVSWQYYRDLDVTFEAFKANEFDFWFENQAQRWAQSYDFPAAKNGKVVKELVSLEKVSGAMVGFIPNLRRPLFQDVRVRRALNLVFDFEQLNQDIFFGQYERINSFFYGIPIGAHGLPTGKELDILNSVKGQAPPEVFTTEYKNPVNGDPQKVRDNLRMAVDLLQQAGFKLQGTTLLDPQGKPVTFEILLNGPVIERVALPFAMALARVGITANVRSVDSNQYVTRLRARDFDMTYNAWGQSNSPGNEQLDFWGSKAADSESSRNYAGIKNPAVDAIIDKIIFAKDRDEQVAAVGALDRVLLWNQYVIPSYTILKDRIAYWNKFGHPTPYPKYSEGFPTVWWWDAAKAATTAGG
jgi:microcin C transport system substrate-binding protein